MKYFEFNFYSFLALLISLGTLIVVILSYKRGRRLDNENYLFKMKLEAYSKILEELEKLIWFLYESIQKVNKPQIYNLDENDIYKLADVIDDRIYNFNNLLVGYSLYITENVDEKLHLIILHLYEHNEDINLNNYKIYHLKLIQLSNELNEGMREDLQIEVLDRKLFERMNDSTFFMNKLRNKRK